MTIQNKLSSWSSLIVSTIHNFSLITGFLLITLLPIYGLALFLMLKRRDFQPLKSRSVSLIFISTLGNMIYFFLLMMTKINDSSHWESWQQLQDPNLTKSEYTPALKTMIYASCEMSELKTWLAQSMVFYPYVLRAIRLYQIFHYGDILVQN